jgi:hypothetical protein
MKPMNFVLLAAIVLISPTISHAQVAGSTLLGVSVAELQEVVKGWSVKRTILGQPVYNDNNERVGSVDDIIVTDKAVSYAIINAGGFLALAKHDVAIPRFSVQVSRQQVGSARRFEGRIESSS